MNQSTLYAILLAALDKSLANGTITLAEYVTQFYQLQA